MEKTRGKRASSETTLLAASLTADSFDAATDILCRMLIGCWNTVSGNELQIARRLSTMGYLREDQDAPRHFAFTTKGERVKADLRKGDGACKVKDSYQSKRNPMTPRPRKDTENMDDPRGPFGEFLRDRIAKLGGDEEKIAKDLGYETGRTLRKWMEGVHGPAFQDLDRIAVALGLDDWYALAAAVKKFQERKKK